MSNQIVQKLKKYSGSLAGLVLAAALLAGCGAQGGDSASMISSTESGDNSSMTAAEVQTGMKIGWNLGNDLDCIDNQKSGDAAHYESLWGNQPVTLSSIEAIKDEGFGAVRVPVTWADHIGDDGTIDAEWMSRVREVVDYVIDSGMYCILDAHHDTGENARINADSASLDDNKKKLTSLWTQIADEFRDYDSHLVFEGFNEILDSGNHWTDPDSSCYDAVNELNQAFVDAVRKTGGNNAERVLLCDAYASGFNADILGNFKLPDDSAKNRLMVDIHYYGTDTSEMKSVAKRIDKLFTKKKVPVIIGECGMKNTAGSSNTDERVAYIKALVDTMKKSGAICFWWDDGGSFSSSDEVNNYALLNRDGGWYFKEIADTMISASGK
ncbi:MAG: glycoside hydrolase family 5 protein [Chordicoccus sp.]